MWNSLHCRWRQTPTTSQPRQPSSSSGTRCEWIIIREQTLRMWRKRLNNTQKTTQETAATPTFQRDTWVLTLFYWRPSALRAFCSDSLASVLCCAVFQMDLMPFVNKAGCECLNESDDCGFENCLNKEPSYLESDCDEQVSAAALTSHLQPNLFTSRDWYR